jgi:hypothetical protein
MPVPKPRKISTSSTMTTSFVHNNIKDGISAPTTKEVTIITLLNIRVIKVIVIERSKLARGGVNSLN